MQKNIEIPTLKEGNGKELRELNNTAQQDIRALKCMDHEPSKTILTSLLQLKLEPTTRFEWQKHNQSEVDVAHYNGLLEFINLRAQATETLSPDRPQQKEGNFTCRNRQPHHQASFVVGASSNCTVCKSDKHPLYLCPTFKAMPRDKIISILRSNNLCINCLKPNHFARQCPSLHKCKKCKKCTTAWSMTTKRNRKPLHRPLCPLRPLS